ncbi:hypothetical protein RND71_029770 [Anisodus tanguticus]|uniref:Uncharacterized protein n=1 Tax=Anisodus tanguticus TaxID=243964 RepID=A0AAE1RGG9_9SOLA|nr:hypothetical protein RND71_029770 [Anisodus tanguticus]
MAPKAEKKPAATEEKEAEKAPAEKKPKRQGRSYQRKQVQLVLTRRRRDFINDIFEKLAQESSRLARSLLLLLGKFRLPLGLCCLVCLATHAVSEGSQAVAKFTSS